MTGITFKGFRGKKPRTDARLLPDNQGTEALNLKITSGRIDPINGLGLVHTSLAAAIKTMYRYRFGVATDNWLVWANDVVDVAKSTTSQDALGRFYFTGDGEPRMSTYAAAISGGGPYPAGWFVLGVVPPKTAATLAVVGGAGPTEARAYVYTFVTPLGEESAPSPAVLVTGNTTGGASWNLSVMDVAPPNSGTISAAAYSAGFVTVTLDTVFGLRAYEEITFAAVAGMTDLNGTFPIVSVDTALNKVVVALTTAQTYSAAADTWTRVAPHNTTGMTKRIYRTVGTNTDYKFVAEIAVATTTYADTIAATALGSGIDSLDNDLPPKNGHSIINLANSTLAMIAGNELCISDFGKPYAWPTANRYAFAGNGVALAAAGNTALVLTDGFPIAFDASSPDSASPNKIETLAPCVAKRGAVDVGSGVIYPSFDGLYILTPGGVNKVTQSLYRHDEWPDTMPATFKAAVWDGQYMAMHDTAVVDEDRILVLDVNEPDGVTEMGLQVDAIYANPYDGLLYMAVGNKIYQWDGDANNRLLAFWQSREMQIGKPTNFVWAQVHARYSDIVPVDTSQIAANTALMANADNADGAIGAGGILSYAIAGSAIVPVDPVTARTVQFTLLVNGVPVFTKNLTSSKAFRLPAGFKSEIQAIQISSNVPVYSASLATSIEELKAIS